MQMQKVLIVMMCSFLMLAGKNGSRKFPVAVLISGQVSPAVRAQQKLDDKRHT
jgi:hypothetical protein